MDFIFFSIIIIILCCIMVMYYVLVTVLFLFQKPAINNTWISKECLCDFMLWNE